jgi:hypothetical protein
MIAALLRLVGECACRQGQEEFDVQRRRPLAETGQCAGEGAFSVSGGRGRLGAYGVEVEA